MTESNTLSKIEENAPDNKFLSLLNDVLTNSIPPFNLSKLTTNLSLIKSLVFLNLFLRNGPTFSPRFFIFSIPILIASPNLEATTLDISDKLSIPILMLFPKSETKLTPRFFIDVIASVIEDGICLDMKFDNFVILSRPILITFPKPFTIAVPRFFNDEIPIFMAFTKKPSIALVNFNMLFKPLEITDKESLPIVFHNCLNPFIALLIPLISVVPKPLANPPIALPKIVVICGNGFILLYNSINRVLALEICIGRFWINVVATLKPSDNLPTASIVRFIPSNRRGTNCCLNLMNIANRPILNAVDNKPIPVAN